MAAPFPSKLHQVTPLLYSHPISRLTDHAIYLKCESLQPSGSFKDRGLGQLCLHYAKTGVQGFICSSGGNAGMAVAYAGQVLNLPTTIVLPEITPPMMIEKLQKEATKVIISGENWNASDLLARNMMAEEHLAYIPPFDHPIIWEGHSSIIGELQKAHVKPDAIIVSVGGGGLMTGLIHGLYAIGWQDVAIITAETQGADSLAAAVKAKKRISLPKIDTVAVTLGAKQICEAAFEWTQKHPVLPQVVSDKAAVRACLRFADDHRQLVEPACGAALAVLYDQHPIIEPYQNIVLIVCGGNGVSLDLLQKWKTQFQI